MKTPFLNTMLLYPFMGNGIRTLCCGNGFMKPCFKRSNQRYLRQLRSQQSHRIDIRWIMSRSHIGVSLHGCQHSFIHALRTTDILGMNRLETDRCQFARILQATPLGKLLQAKRNSRGMILCHNLGIGTGSTRFNKARRHRCADSLDASSCQQLFPVHIKQTVLEAGATKVCHQYLHQEAPLLA